MRRAIVVGVLGILATLLYVPECAEAAEIPWKTSHFELVAGGKDLKELLRNLGASQNVSTWISPQVTGAVTGKFSTTPGQFLGLMSSAFGISWYFDGSVLYIYGANETKSATVGLTASAITALQGALDHMGIADQRFPLRVDQKARVVMVSGPPRYVELVTQIAQVVGRNAQQFDGPEVRVFPLRYAWAADHTVQLEGKAVTIPGVERILNSIFAAGANQQAADFANRELSRTARGDATRQVATTTQPPTEQVPKPGSFGAWLGAGSTGAVAMNPPLPPGNLPEGQADVPLPDGSPGEYPAPARRASARESGGPGRAALPAIHADPRTNAIIVRDMPENMNVYADLIASLDTKPKVIEISATIIDVTDSALEQLGVDWRLHSSHLDAQTGNGRRAQAGNPDSLNPDGFPDPTRFTRSTVAATPIGGVLTAVIGGSATYLLSRISAMQQSEQAKITETPKIATLDNVEAVMNNRQTMHVRVAGYQTAQLFSISAGVSLRVLPTVVEDEGTTRLRLGVHIDDGQLTERMVDQIPIVNNSQIDTQALIAEGQSLLIAGYSVDQTSITEGGVPGLSKIPILGKLFQYTEKNGRKYHRLFMLTPRILEL